MATPTFQLQCDFNDDGDFLDTGETISTGRIRRIVCDRGRDDASQLTGRSVGGKLTAVLDNRSGDYNSFNTGSPIAGNALPGRVVRLRVNGRAAQFTAANSEYLSGGDVIDITTTDFSIAFWLYIDSAGQFGIVNKRDRASATNVGYAIELQADGTLDLLISDGTSVTTISSTTNLGTGAWKFCVLTADRDGNAQFYIDAGSAEGAASIVSQNGTLANAITFQIGAGFSSSADRFFGGRMVTAAIWTKLLSSAERTFLYNSGSGVNYSEIGLTGDGSALKTSLQGWWELDEASGSRSDSENSNTLTDNATVTDADGIPNHALWQGYLSAIRPRALLSGDNICILEAHGPLSQINIHDMSLAMRTNELTDVTIGAILDEVGFSSTQRSLDAGKTTITRYTADRKSPLTAMQEIEAAESGFLWETRDGRIAFDNRHSRLGGAASTSQATMSDAGGAALAYSGIEQQDPMASLFNIFSASVTIDTVASIATLWTLDQVGAASVGIAPGDSFTWWASYPNPGTATDGAWAVDAWTTPVTATDWNFNSVAGGGGTDITSSVAIAVSKLGNRMKMTFTNNHASLTAYVQDLKARGTAITRGDPITIREEDTTSQNTYNVEREWPAQTRYIPDTQEAFDWAKFQLAIYKDPNPMLSMMIIPNRSQAMVDEMIDREIGDRVTVVAQSNADLDINRDFFIERIRHVIRNDRIVQTTYLLSDAEQFSDWWVWGTSKWGTTTRWAY